MTCDDEGATPIIGFIIALAVVGSLFTYVVVDTAREGSGSTMRDATELDLRAGALADLVVLSPGQGWYPDSACTSDGTDAKQMHADQVSADNGGRFGLGVESCDIGINATVGSNQLDYDKILNLRGARREADASNGYLDYDESRGSLGLDQDALDFHIRSEPVLASVRQILASGVKDQYLRPLYIGDYEEVGAGGQALVREVEHTAGVEDTSVGMKPWVNITNNGTSSTAFEVVFTVPLSEGNIILERHTGVIAPAAFENVSVELPDTGDWAWADPSDPSVLYTISDVQGGVGSGLLSTTGIVMAQGIDEHILVTKADGLEEELSGSGSANARIHYESYAGDGTQVKHSDWRLRVDPSTDVTPSSPVILPNRMSGFEGFEFTAAGAYKAILESADGSTEYSNDTVNVVSSPIDPFQPLGSTGTFEPQEPVEPEAGYIDRVIEHFEANVFAAEYSYSPDMVYAPGGDVFPDIKNVMNNQLPLYLIDDKGTATQADDEATLETYNVMVVGSNVDHQVMTSAAAKQTIRDWVYAGGTLIVFGSTEQAVQWLQPIFHSAIETANGGISTPDPTHPVLNVPNKLDYDSYDTHNIVWDLNREQDEAHFTHVVTNEDDDYLAVSDPGEFGAGRVILASYQPFDLLKGQDSPCDPYGAAACPGMQLFHNLVTIAYHGLYLDYGPPLPTDRPHGSVVRVASVHHPDLERRVTVVIQFYVF